MKIFIKVGLAMLMAMSQSPTTRIEAAEIDLIYASMRFKMRRHNNQMMSSRRMLDNGMKSRLLSNGRKPGGQEINIERTISQFAEAITAERVCKSIKDMLKTPEGAKCDNSVISMNENGQLTINVYKTSPGERHYRADITGSSELLAINKTDGTESHKYDILFMLDFDTSPYVNIYDLEARINYRSPKQVKDADWKIMTRDNDSQNSDFIAQMASRISDDFIEYHIPVRTINAHR